MKRAAKTTRKRKHQYLLSNLIFMEIAQDNRIIRMTCSTSNPARPGGGTSHYRIANCDINMLCSDIEKQVTNYLIWIQVSPEIMSLIRECYTAEIAEKLGHHRPTERIRIEAALKTVDDEEARAARLFATGKITEAVWDNLWEEWQDRRRTLRHALEAASRQTDYHVTQLDEALHVISQISVLFRRLDASSQRELLREVVERVVVSSDGKVIRMELFPPFSYLHDLANRTSGGGPSSNGAGNKITSGKTGYCSTKLQSGGPNKSQNEHPLQYKTAYFLQQLMFPQSACLVRLSNKH